MKTKICVECKQEKELSIEYFEIWYRSSTGKDPRYANSCKVCRRKSGNIIKEYKMNNPLPDNYDWDLNDCMGICSDYIKKYENIN